MKMFKMGILFFVGALSLALNVAGSASLWGAAAPPTITQVQRTADGYMLMGSGFDVSSIMGVSGLKKRKAAEKVEGRPFSIIPLCLLSSGHVSLFNNYYS